MTEFKTLSLALCCLLCSTMIQAQLTWTLTQASLNGSGDPCNTAASDGWASGGFSLDVIPSGTNGSVTGTWYSGDQDRAIGLSETNSNGDWRGIDFKFLLSASSADVYEGTNYKGSFGVPKNGDTYSVEANGSHIDFKINGALVFQSTRPGSADFYADFALFYVDDCFEIEGNMQAPPVYPFAQLLRKVDAGFVRTHDEILYIAYPEDYGQESGTKLYYEILDGAQVVKASVSEAGTASPAASPAMVITHGENHLELDLSGVTLDVGSMYTLVTYNRKNEKRYLKFVFEQDMPN